ncbi:MAG TPA: sulfatase [Pirellulales bacterium]|jgi:arylsulfatase A-like enzyme|nr:sulfatase [Pirellulales bacterium]
MMSRSLAGSFRFWPRLKPRASNLKPLLLWLPLALWLVSLAPQRPVQSAEPPRRPNIVFLLADDQRFDAFGAAGNTIVRTPAIDRLAAQGCRFANHFVTTSICCVSRASMLTGQYARRHGINDFDQSLAADAWSQTYPALLHAAGYRTGLVGHLGVGKETPPDMFDDCETFKAHGDYFEPGDSTHMTARIGSRAIEFIEACAPSKPFYLSVGFTAPHAHDGAPREFPPDARDEALYVDAVIPVPAGADDATFRRLPDFVQRSEGRRRWQPRYSTGALFQQTVKDYYRLITGIDREVGRIVAALAAKKLADDTIIVFSSDNGFFLGERGMADKWLMYEPSIRVPLVVVDPRLPAENRNRKIDTITLNIDLAPTLLDYAGVAAPAAMQGRSLRPLLAAAPGVGPPADWRSDFFYEHHTFPAILPPSEGVRTDDWKYIRYVEPNPLVEELYDLAADPAELHNLALDPAHRPTLDRLRARWSELGQTVR